MPRILGSLELLQNPSPRKKQNLTFPPASGSIGAQPGAGFGFVDRIGLLSFDGFAFPSARHFSDLRLPQSQSSKQAISYFSRF